MPQARAFRIVESVAASVRLAEAEVFLQQFPPSLPVTIIASSRGAADDLARRLAFHRGATLGLERLSLTQAAARAAAPGLAEAGVVPATTLGSEAVAARAAFEVARTGELSTLWAVAGMPGFPRTLARTLEALRGVGVTPRELPPAGAAGPDLARLLGRSAREFEAAEVVHRTAVFDLATAAVRPDDDRPLLLLDVAITSPAEERFVAALLARARAACATAPARDERSLEALVRAGGTREVHPESGEGDLPSLRRHLFAETSPPKRRLDGTLEFFSAPGEGREAVEIVRRVLREAGRGVPFDEMAVLVRAPHQYHGLLEHALDRAEVPAWFDRGARRPHPAGRAFLALLGGGTMARDLRTDGLVASGAPPASQVTTGDEPAPAGTLRAPRRWEHLLVEASVVGGDAARWRRRLDGLAEDFKARLREARREDPESARSLGLARETERLATLRDFALPLIDEMAGWSEPAPWGRWLERLERFAPQVLRRPAGIEAVLADLRPMAAVGPVPLAQVRDVLADRLLTVASDPPARRYGRVFVGSPEQARGRTFRVVFVPGLAERMFPQKAREDPLLPDDARGRLERGLATRTETSQHGGSCCTWQRGRPPSGCTCRIRAST